MEYYELYANQMAPLGHGLALWEPEPSPVSMYQKVEIADVGFMREGHFCRLFNATLSEDDKKNNLGVPTDYIPIKLSSDAITNQDLKARRALWGSVDKELDLDVSADLPLLQACVGAEVKFHSSTGNGAMLVTGHDMKGTRALQNIRFKEYIKMHHESWLEFANHRHGFGIRLQDLMLVYGYHVTVDFVTFAFSDMKGEAQVKLNAGLVGAAAGSLALASSSHPSVSPAVNSGPRVQVPAGAPDSERYKQCVFLKRWRIQRVAGIGPKVIKGRGGPHDLGSGHRSEGEDVGVGGENNSDLSLEGMEIVSDTKPAIDPTDPLMEYIFNNSEAELALVNDDDLSELYQLRKEVDGDVTSLLQRITPKIEVKDGVGQLRIESSGSSKPMVPSPYPRASQTHDKIRDELRALHTDELAYLSRDWQTSSVRKAMSSSYIYLCWRTTRRYVHYLWYTWTRAVWSTFFLPTTFLDRLSIFAFALVSSWIVLFLLLWCLVTNHPLLIRAFNRWSRTRANGLSMTNAAYPTMFEELSEEQIHAARAALAEPLGGSLDSTTKRVFNLDIAKLLLQCSAIMYERTSAPLHNALEVSVDQPNRHPRRQQADLHASRARLASKPGALLSANFGADAAQQASTHLHSNAEEDALSAFAARLGVKYNTVSELNTPSSAFCGMFWDPESTWIILAYKGTTPTEFVEWTTDFSFNPQEAGHWIRGWGKVHGGFMDKIFPRRLKSGSRLPYHTISEAVKATSKHLLADKPAGTQINVWTTGHSLGCALASLVYARQINEPRDMGRSVVVRDAYLFAAPILCDVESVNAFNNRMNHDADHPRTMWRITNGKDVVARSLPHAGDHAAWNLSPYNLFSFAHIGTELRMKPAPACSAVAGETHITPGTDVRVESALARNVSLLRRDAAARRAQAAVRRVQALPVVGRLVSHGTVSYWMALDAVGTGSCEWDAD